MNGAAHLTLPVSSQLCREVIFSPPEQLNCPAHLGAGLWTFSTFWKMPVRKRFPLPSGLGLLSPLPWPLEFDGFRGRDSTGGIQLQVHLLLWLPADQWVEADLGRVAGTWIQAQEKQEEKKTSHWAAVCSNYASWAKTGLSRGHQWAGWSSPVSSLFTALLLMHSCLFSHLF